MNASRPPMNKVEFLDGMTPIWFVFSDGEQAQVSAVAFIKDDLCRWLISEKDRKQWTDNVITKEAVVWDDLIRPGCERLQVMDEAINKIYYISAQDFEENKEVVKKGGRAYYVIRRDLWEQELLTMYQDMN